MRSVLITGASGGIGRATARLFAKQGYAVAVHYHRSRETAESLVRELEAAGANAIPVGADVSNDREVAEMVRQTESVFGEISVFIHNAGTASQKLLTDLPPEEWRALMGVHLDGAYYGCRHVIPGMVRRKWGKILFVSSMWGVTGASCEAAYSAAKAGLIGLTKALAKELGPSSIQVNCVAPGVPPCVRAWMRLSAVPWRRRRRSAGWGRRRMWRPPCAFLPPMRRVLSPGRCLVWTAGLPSND